ncbi:UpxY family transcription antiterminator [Sinomicrobium oceani]|uniref:UpxY family transcription antiterminator n=1 Tax=Sinomicrobium oceani TaxID=1150368 RepID=UPI00227B71F2|nr:UpxY family transcription antiterminator [Sinomicrobium oceani]
MFYNTYNGWHVLYVKSRHEKKVHHLLLKASVESFLPLVKIKRQWSDRKKNILKPLFPSYVFVNVHSSMDFYKALEVNGVCTFLRFGQEYAKVPGKEVDKIKILLGLKDVTSIQASVRVPKVGDIKKVTYGSLSGLECEVLRIDHNNKVMVRIGIDALQQNITAFVPAYYLS